MKIAIITELPREGFSRLVERGIDDWSLVNGDWSLVNGDWSLVNGQCATSEWKEADVLISTFDKPVSREMIDGMPHLRLIANFGAGFNNIDLEACRERGIRVTNTPQPVIEPTAELAFALMIAVARRVSEFDRTIRQGTCQPMAVMNHLSHSLYGKTLGILGMGRIGQALARRAVASGMKIIYHNRHKIDVQRNKVQGTKDARMDEWTKEVIEDANYVDFQTLLQESDFLSLNLPYTPEVHHIIGKPELGMMKRSAYLINTARGAHVDEAALVEALQSGIIAGAALDVYEFEPKISEALLTLPNVVLSPHTGTGTMEGRIAMCENVCDNILAFLDNCPEAMNLVL